MANVVAQPHFIFGLRTGVKNNLCFCDEQTVVFPAGNNCVCYNTIRSSQRLVPGRPQIQVSYASFQGLAVHRLQSTLNTELK